MYLLVLTLFEYWSILAGIIESIHKRTYLWSHTQMTFEFGSFIVASHTTVEKHIYKPTKHPLLNGQCVIFAELTNKIDQITRNVRNFSVWIRSMSMSMIATTTSHILNLLYRIKYQIFYESYRNREEKMRLIQSIIFSKKRRKTQLHFFVWQ